MIYIRMTNGITCAQVKITNLILASKFVIFCQEYFVVLGLSVTKRSVYRPLSPGGNPLAVNKYHIVSYHNPSESTNWHPIRFRWISQLIWLDIYVIIAKKLADYKNIYVTFA